jgi:dTDP-4-amino-4,6-dideoxygalactose transaminase
VKVPFVDLRPMHEEVRSEIEAAFKEIFDRSSFIGGTYVDTFERGFAAYCGVRAAVACANGTDAVKLALMAAGVRAGDAVITASHTFIATAEAITMIGAHPIFIEIEADTYHLSPAALEACILEKCRLGADGHWIDGKSRRPVTAVLPVQLYGMVANMKSILGLAEKYNLIVVEDDAQAHGASYVMAGKTMKAGSMGRTGAFSFYPGKNLGAMGEGGAVVTNDESAAQQMRIWRDHGSSQQYVHISPDGWNSRLDTLQCAILDIKLKKLDEWNGRRRQVATWYRERLGGNEKIVLPAVPVDREHIYHLYVVRLPERERVMQELGARGISCGLHYPIPLHLQPAYRDLGYCQGDFPITESVAGSILSLPMFPHMTEEMVDFVCSELEEVLEDKMEMVRIASVDS